MSLLGIRGGQPGYNMRNCASASLSKARPLSAMLLADADLCPQNTGGDQCGHRFSRCLCACHLRATPRTTPADTRAGQVEIAQDER